MGHKCKGHKVVSHKQDVDKTIEYMKSFVKENAKQKGSEKVEVPAEIAAAF